MKPGQKVALFVAALVLIAGLGAVVGAAVGPIDTGSSDDEHAGEEHADGDHAEGDAAAPEPVDASAPATVAAALGTSSVQDGYRLVLDPPDDELRFRVLDPDGAAVVATEVVHDRPLHLIVVGRDLRSYHHLHPEVDAEGTWSVAWPAVTPGSHRVVADLTPEGGPALVLAADVTVPGEIPDLDVPAVAATAEVDGLDVAIEGDALVGDSDLAFTVTRGGEPVELEPYLGARGHLVAFRTSDLAYSHVHPHDGDEGPVAFTASFPSAGTYRLFLDVQVGGEVHTASFTVEVDGGGSAAAPDASTDTTTPPADTSTPPAETSHQEDDHDH